MEVLKMVMMERKLVVYYNPENANIINRSMYSLSIDSPEGVEIHNFATYLELLEAIQEITAQWSIILGGRIT